MNQELIVQLEKKRLNLSHYLLLQDIKKGVKIEEDTKKTSAWATLIRKDYVTEHGFTESGSDLWDSLLTATKKKRTKSVAKGADEMFEEWWTAYPPTDRIVDGDTEVFSATRSLRSGKKEKVKEKYMEILLEGKYTHEELMGALKYEVDMRVNQSLDKGENKLTFMKGSAPYLNQAEYESFIALSKTKGKSNPKSDSIII